MIMAASKKITPPVAFRRVGRGGIDGLLIGAERSNVKGRRHAGVPHLTTIRGAQRKEAIPSSTFPRGNSRSHIPNSKGGSSPPPIPWKFQLGIWNCP